MATPAPALFPMFAQLRGRDVLVVGGGSVAYRKVTALLDAGARVRIHAPVLDPALATLARAGRVRHLCGQFDARSLDKAWLVVAATDDANANRAVAAAAGLRRVWTNVVDDVELSSFHVPAVVRRGTVQVAISSGGAAPMVARHLRAWIERLLDDSWGALADLLAQRRSIIRARYPALGLRRRWFERVLQSEVPGLLRQQRREAVIQALDAALDATPVAPRGSVALVGAGPGDPGLLTLSALRALNEADVIIHDRLVSHDVLALARRDARRIDVGKAVGARRDSQSHIHALLLQHARAGKRVVRLKGGDPFVFGRGGEELEFLRAHGIDYEVVPGITAALACAAYAGVPLTHRDHARSVRLITAHCHDSLDAIDWRSLAEPTQATGGQTLVVYMGVGQLQRLRANLLAHGGRPELPFALVENGSRPGQRVVTGPLAQLPELAQAHAIVAPALLILGEVARFATQLHWFGASPLAASAATAPPHAALRHAA